MQSEMRIVKKIKIKLKHIFAVILRRLFENQRETIKKYLKMKSSNGNSQIEDKINGTNKIMKSHFQIDP